ncbi:MAG TPA: chromosomal replication initiator protein DnaA [Candidatus Paceibacterota bacterium]
MITTITDNKKIWEDALIQIEQDISRASFVTWFKNTSIQKLDGGVAYIGVPNTFVRDWLQNKYHSSILKILREGIDGLRAVEYIISRSGIKTDPVDQILPQTHNQQLGLGDIYVNKENNLNQRYTFENFVVGSFNELAYAAAQAIIKNPGISYNPLFIYGGTGLGKTHLIQAVGNSFQKNNKDNKVYYLSAEKFGIEYTDSVRNGKAHIFKEKYRKYDVLIMDDIQFLSGKDKIQEEVFHLFNILYDNNKQIIFSSDKAPKQITGIEDRLKSRFEGGMIADISIPEYESRLAILNSKTRQHNIAIAIEILEYVASIVQNNIRELEGVLNLISAQCQLKKRDLSISEVKQLIKNSLKPQKIISINDVIKTIANFYNIDERELYQKTRKKEVVKPRQVAMYILREDFNTSYPYIGQKLGGRDHTTVIHAYEKIKRDLIKDNILYQEIEQIKTILYGTP